MYPRRTLRGGLPLQGYRAGRGDAQWVIGLLRAGRLCHFCARPWAARVVLPLLRCALCALAVWLCCSWGREPRGARVRSVGWSVPDSGTGVIAPCSRGGVFWGGGCPPTPCAGLGSAAGSLGRVFVACGPPGSGSAADPGREAANELDAPSAARRGPS